MGQSQVATETATAPPGLDLFDKQGSFLQSEVKFPAFIGGVGAGKTYVGAVKAILTALQTGDPGMIIAPTYRMLSDVTVATILDICEEYGIRHHYRPSRSQITIEGVKVFLRSATEPNKIRGPNLAWAWCDEAAMMRYQVWRVLLGRLRIGSSPTAWITTTPAGFNWIWHRWVERGDSKYVIYRSSSRDNPYLSEDFVADMMADYSVEFARQEIEGEFIQMEGLVYTFREDVHVIDPFTIPKAWPIYRAVDFGFTNPFVCLWIAVDPDGRMYVIEEHYQRRLLLKEHAAIIKSFHHPTPGGRIQTTVADHEAQEAAELASYGVPSIPAKKEIMVGIQEIENRLKVQADGKPRYMVFRNCVHHRKEFSEYHWPEGRDRGLDRSEYERPVKEADHTMDPSRYCAMLLRSGTGHLRKPKASTRKPLTAGYRKQQF